MWSKTSALLRGDALDLASPLWSIGPLLFFGSVAAAQPAREEMLIEPYRVDSGVHDGSVDESPIVFQQWIDYPGTQPPRTLHSQPIEHAPGRAAERRRGHHTHDQHVGAIGSRCQNLWLWMLSSATFKSFSPSYIDCMKGAGPQK